MSVYSFDFYDQIGMLIHKCKLVIFGGSYLFLLN